VGSGVLVNKVTLNAVVQGASMEMDWHNVTVKFYVGTLIVETDAVPDFGASTMTSGTSQQAVTVVTPTVPLCTGVSVVGQVRMQAAAGTPVGPNDVFGQVMIT
jgi:hypothetical protein